MRRTLRLALLVVPGVIALVVLLLAALPDGRYLLRAGWEEARILAARRPITEVVSDPATPTWLRERLRLVLDARTFAEESLGLRADGSFTTYAPVRRDTLVLVLSAAYRDRLEPYRWWFPIVGRVPYKGFFDFEAARRARDEFLARGFDTFLRPASAFSTLGWFNDPLLSTTVRSDTTDLVNTVLHELTHSTLFVKGAVEFNESFASFVGARGAAAFFRARGAEAAARHVEAAWEDEKRLGAFWRDLSRRLDSAYAAWPDDSAARVRARDTVYARARRLLVDSVGPLLHTVPAERLARIQLDNAALLARRVYAEDLGIFDEVFERSGREVRIAIERIIAVARGSDDPFQRLRDWLAG